MDTVKNCTTCKYGDLSSFSEPCDTCGYGQGEGDKPNNWRSEDEPVKATDTQVGGNHYQSAKIQPIEFIVQNNIPFREANAIKYIFRHRSKNGKQDIEKAIHYLQMILEEYNDPVR